MANGSTKPGATHLHQEMFLLPQMWKYPSLGFEVSVRNGNVHIVALVCITFSISSLLPSCVFVLFSVYQALGHGSESMGVINASRTSLLSLEVRKRFSAVTATTWSFSCGTRGEPPDMHGPSLSLLHQLCADSLNNGIHSINKHTRLKLKHTHWRVFCSHWWWPDLGSVYTQWILLHFNITKRISNSF